MRIITWNCNMAFRKKAAAILAYDPDILVIPECEHPDKLQFAAGSRLPTDIVWLGENKNKGLCILSYCDYRFKIHRTHNKDLRMVVPVTVTNGPFDFTLFAIWANNPNDPDGQYVEQVWKAVNHYKRLLKNRPVILAGDFNSNTIWDKPKRKGNHSTVVAYLEERKIYSIYHRHFNQEQGKEKHPTLYLYRHRDKPYHLDYCFVSDGFLGSLQSVEVGDYDAWTKYSDHVPLIVTFVN